MTKGLATNPIDVARDDDKEILEFIKKNNLDLKTLIYTFSETTPKNALSEQDKEILEFIKTSKLDLQKLKNLEQKKDILELTEQEKIGLSNTKSQKYSFTETSSKNDISEDQKKILDLIKKENLDSQKFRYLVELSKTRGLAEDSRPAVKKILDFMERENIQIKDFEERTNLPRTSVRKFIYTTRSESMSLYSMLKIADFMNLSLDELILDEKIPIKREKNLPPQEIRDFLIEKIKAFLEKNNMSKLNLETKSSIKSSSITRLFSKKIKSIRISSLIAMSQIMQCHLEDFMPSKKN